MDEEFRRALDIILEVMRTSGNPDADDAGAVRWAVLSHAMCIEQGAVVMAPAVFSALQAEQVAVVLTQVFDMTVRPEWQDDGRIAFVTDEGRMVADVDADGWQTPATAH